jgi:hypothetical protein
MWDCLAGLYQAAEKDNIHSGDAEARKALWLFLIAIQPFIVCVSAVKTGFSSSC